MSKKVNAEKLYERLQAGAVNFSRLSKYTKLGRQHMQYGLEKAADPIPYLANLKDGLQLMVVELRGIIRLIDAEIKSLKDEKYGR